MLNFITYGNLVCGDGLVGEHASIRFALNVAGCQLKSCPLSVVSRQLFFFHELKAKAETDKLLEFVQAAGERACG